MDATMASRCAQPRAQLDLFLFGFECFSQGWLPLQLLIVIGKFYDALMNPCVPRVLKISDTTCVHKRWGARLFIAH